MPRCCCHSSALAGEVSGHLASPALFPPSAALAFWLWCSVLVHSSAAAAGWLSGLPAADPFNRPYLSTSLADYWRRWNDVPVRRGFRTLLYDPICGPAQRRHGGRPPAWRRFAAMCAVFAASGVGHEATLVYLTHRFTGERRRPGSGGEPAGLPVQRQLSPTRASRHNLQAAGCSSSACKGPW